MPLKPYILEFEKQAGGPVIFPSNVPGMRRLAEQQCRLLATLAHPPSGNVQVDKVEIGSIPVSIYRPRSVTNDLPVMVWMHGGGLCFRTDDNALLERICEFGQFVVFALQYRLGPEDKWPAMAEDCLSVYRWAHGHARFYNGDNSRMYPAGASAGGLLAFNLTRNLLRDPELKGTIKGIVALTPWFVHPDGVPQKYSQQYKKHLDHPDRKTVPGPDVNAMLTFAKESGAMAGDADTFPLNAVAEERISFPPTFIVSAESDVLYGEAKLMEEALNEAGTSVKHDAYEGLPHYFWGVHSWPDSQTFVRKDLVDSLKWLKSQS